MEILNNYVDACQYRVEGMKLSMMVLNDRVDKPTYKYLVKLEGLFITAKLKWVRIRQKEHIV